MKSKCNLGPKNSSEGKRKLYNNDIDNDNNDNDINDNNNNYNRNNTKKSCISAPD